MQDSKKETYNHYIAIDWAQRTVSLANMTAYSEKPKTRELTPNIKEIKKILNNLKGSKILTFEETTGSHWLYVELIDEVDRLIVCNPYKNRLLSDGPKTDKIDAGKLCELLRSNLLKEVYHSLNEDYHIRKLVSGYNDLVKAGVRVMNQRSALYRSEGLRYKIDKIDKSKNYSHFVESQQLSSIEHYNNNKKLYEKIFRQIRRQNPIVKNLSEISGLETKTAVKIYGIVIDATRFETKYKYWAYCGLVYHLRESGKKIYGRKKPKHSRELKSIYKGAVVAALRGRNDIREYFEYMREKGISVKDARNQIARYIAKVTYAMMKSGKPYKPYSWRDK